MAKTFQENVILGRVGNQILGVNIDGGIYVVVSKDFDAFIETHHQELGCTQKTLFTCQWLMIVSASELKS